MIAEKHGFIIYRLEALSNPRSIEGMSRYGITPSRVMEYPYLNCAGWQRKQERTMNWPCSSGLTIPGKPVSLRV
jgi:hypothetical protein